MDFVSDQNPRPIYLAAEVLGLPDYVKESAVLQPGDLVELSSGAFADFVSRELPIHTKAATWLSAAYFYGSSRSGGAVEAALLKAATFHGIRDEVDRMHDPLQAAIKSASAHVIPYALSVDFGGTAGKGVEHFYPLGEAGDIVESARVMLKDADARRLPVDALRSAAVELVKAARAQRVDLAQIHPRIINLGTERLPNFAHAAKTAADRGWAGVGAEGLGLFEDLVKDAAAHPEQLDDYIGLWLDLDASHQVKYSSTVLDPYQAFYAGESLHELEKLASEVVLVGDVMVPKAVFAGLDEEKVAQLFSKEAATQVLALREQASAHPGDVSSAIAAFSDIDRRTLLEALLAA